MVFSRWWFWVNYAAPIFHTNIWLDIFQEEKVFLLIKQTLAFLFCAACIASVNRLDYFWKFLATNFLAKVPQKLVTFGAVLKIKLMWLFLGNFYSYIKSLRQSVMTLKYIQFIFPHNHLRCERTTAPLGRQLMHSAACTNWWDLFECLLECHFPKRRHIPNAMFSQMLTTSVLNARISQGNYSYRLNL